MYGEFCIIQVFVCVCERVDLYDVQYSKTVYVRYSNGPCVQYIRYISKSLSVTSALYSFAICMLYSTYCIVGSYFFSKNKIL